MKGIGMKLDFNSQDAVHCTPERHETGPNSLACNCIQFSTNADSYRLKKLPPRWLVCEDFLVEKPAKAQVEIVDKRLKNMMKELGDAINSSLSDSEQIAEVISRIKADGYDVFVVLEATIGFNEHEGEGEAEELPRSIAEFKVTSQDLKFLKSLRIRVEED